MLKKKERKSESENNFKPLDRDLGGLWMGEGYLSLPFCCQRGITEGLKLVCWGITSQILHWGCWEPCPEVSGLPAHFCFLLQPRRKRMKAGTRARGGWDGPGLSGFTGAQCADLCAGIWAHWCHQGTVLQWMIHWQVSSQLFKTTSSTVLLVPSNWGHSKLSSTASFTLVLLVHHTWKQSGSFPQMSLLLPTDLDSEYNTSCWNGSSSFSAWSQHLPGSWCWQMPSWWTRGGLKAHLMSEKTVICTTAHN